MFHPTDWRWPWRGAAVGAILFAVAVLIGCNRKYYRDSADVEASRMIFEKSNDPRWGFADLNVYGDPRSRFYDAYNRDRPPMPPDDATAHRYMHRVYHMKGFHKWHKDGDVNSVYNPFWEALLPTSGRFTADGKLILDLPTAVVLSRIHSPDYLRNIEEVYLSALDVAFERFNFDVQFFLTNNTFNNETGSLPVPVLGRLNNGVPNSQSIVDTRTRAFFNKNFAAGGQMVAGVANSMVWNFAGPNQSFATTLVNGTFIQPILKNGGKVIAMEQITRVERTLLSNLRAEAQFKQQFFREIAIGGNPDVNPQRIGGFQGGAGLTGFTGIGVGGFGGVGQGLNFGGSPGGAGVGASGAGAATGFAGGGEGIVGGYYGLVQRMQTIRNTEASLAAQLQSLGLLEANFAAGLIQLVQVDEFRQNIETERALLLRNSVALRDSLEVYLISTVGLPPWLPIHLDDSLTKTFQFIDPTLTELQNQTTAILNRSGELPERPNVASIENLRQATRAILDKVPSHVKSLVTELDDLRKSGGRLPQSATDQERKEYLEGIDVVQRTIDDLSARFEDLAKQIEKVAAINVPGREREATGDIVNVLRIMSTQLQEIALLQAGIRVDKIVIDPVELKPEEAFWIASHNRMDWMNRRTALVDQWRLVWFNANRLLAGLNIEINGSLGTNGNNPAHFRGPTGNMEAVLNFDAPITRKSERNLYRQSLIDYQRVRRNYIGFVDGVNLTIRSRLRQMTRLYENLEIQRRALAIAIRRVDQTLEDLNQPFEPTPPGQSPAQLGPTLAQNLLRALSDFRNTQDNFLSVWINYQAARISLLIDLGILQLDENGMWVDEPVDQAASRALAEAPLPRTRPDPCDDYLQRIESAYTLNIPPKGLAYLSGLHHRCWTTTPWLDVDIEQWIVESDLVDGPEWPVAELARQAAWYEVDVQPPYPPPQSRYRDRRVLAQWTHWWYNFWELQRYQKAQKQIGGKEAFQFNLRRVGELDQAGVPLAEISKQTGLDEPVVQAYVAAARRVDPQLVRTVPTRAITFAKPPTAVASNDADSAPRVKPTPSKVPVAAGLGKALRALPKVAGNDRSRTVK